MKVKEIYYEESFKFSKNYRSQGEAVGLTVSIDDQEDPDVAFAKLKNLVHIMLHQKEQSSRVEPSKN